MVKGQLLNVYKNLAGMMASSSSSQVWALLHHELFSFFQLNAGLLLEQLQVGKMKEGLEVRVGRHRHHLLSTSFTLLNLSDCLEIFLSGMHFLVIVNYKVKCKLFNHGHGKPSNLTYM